jgi:hypothetical protein
VDNVGVYTNESVWTNSGYGAWTNNYTNQLIYIYDDGAVYFNSSYVLPTDDWGYVSTSNWLMNAKDIRAVDCVNALIERHIALGGSVTNFWAEMLIDWPADVHTWFYRNEVQNLASIKGYISRKLSTFWYTTNNWVTATNLTPSSLAGIANVPTNFLTYTPARAADGSWKHYQHIMTNTFKLCQGTNSTHIATNSLVDSAGINFTAVGTNGLVITRVATNVNQQAGSDIGAYGWDGTRRVISVMIATAYSGGWTNKGEKNENYGYGVRYPSNYPTYFPPFDPRYDWADSAERLTAMTNAHADQIAMMVAKGSNIISASSSDYPTEGTRDWALSSTLNTYAEQQATGIHRYSYPMATIPSNIWSFVPVFYTKIASIRDYTPNSWTNYSLPASARDGDWLLVSIEPTGSVFSVVSTTNFPNNYNPTSHTVWIAGANYISLGWKATEVRALAVWNFEYR